MTAEVRQDVRQGRRGRRPSPRCRPRAEAMEERRLMAASVTTYPVPTPGASPNSIAVDGSGIVWFTERDADKIGRIDTTGSITEFLVPTADAQPTGIAASHGGIVFTEANGHKIGQIDGEGRITEFSLPTPDARPGALAPEPEQGSADNWFAETVPSGTPASGPNRIGVFEEGGAIIEFPLNLPGAEADALTPGRDGNEWFVDGPRNAVGRITPAGAVTEFPIPTAASGASGIATGSDGNLWFTETAAHRIGKVTPDGQFTEYALNTPDASPVGIAAGPDGELWFTETTASGPAIGRINPGTGAITDFPLPAGFVAPTAIAPTPPPILAVWDPPSVSQTPPVPPPAYDTLVFADPSGDRIGRIGTDPAAGFETLDTQPETFGAYQGQAFQDAQVATFVTSLAHLTAGDFTAAIDWGDGSPATTGTVIIPGLPLYTVDPPVPLSAAQGRYAPTFVDFRVSGGHTYAQAGTFPIHVTIRDSFGDTTTVTSQAVVSSLPFVVTPAPVEVLPYSIPTLIVGNLYLADPNPPPTSVLNTEYTVSIDWGDGTTSAGRLEPSYFFPEDPSNLKPVASITGDHTYSHDGAYTISFVVTDAQGRSSTTTNRVVDNTHAPFVFGVFGNALARSPRTGEVADFQDDSRTGATAADYTATIDWGDGTTSAGTVSPYQYFGSPIVPGRFMVTADHTYAHAGRFVDRVTVTRTDGSGSGSTTGGFTAMEPSQFTGYPSLSPGQENPTTGQAFTPWLVTLTTYDTSATTADYTATIDWGDGTPPGPGDVTLIPAVGFPSPLPVTQFTINGGHTYAQAGTYTARVTVRQSDGKTSQFVTDFVVTDPGSNPPPPPPPPPQPIIAPPIYATPPRPTPLPPAPTLLSTAVFATTPQNPRWIFARDLEYLIRLGSIPVGHGRHRRNSLPHPTRPAGVWASRPTFAIRHAHRGHRF